MSVTVLTSRLQSVLSGLTLIKEIDSFFLSAKTASLSGTGEFRDPDILGFNQALCHLSYRTMIFHEDTLAHLSVGNNTFMEGSSVQDSYTLLQPGTTRRLTHLPLAGEIVMEPMVGLEPTVSCLQDRCMCQLCFIGMVSMTGVEPARSMSTTPSRWRGYQLHHIDKKRRERVSLRVCRSPHKIVRCWNRHQPTG